MCHEHEPLEGAERGAERELAAQLGEHVRLCLAVFDTTGMALTAVPARPIRETLPSFKVTSDLLIRLANDVRSIALLGERGYALQAASLSATVYEVAYTIILVGIDDSVAREWIAHDDPTRPFRHIRLLTRDALEKLSIPDIEAVCERQYRVYRQFCLAKHANPLIEMRLGFTGSSADFVGMTGPDTSEAAVRVAQFAMEHAAGLGNTAIKSFILNHISQGARRELLERVDTIERLRGRLRRAAIEKWGREDPFRGRW